MDRTSDSSRLALTAMAGFSGKTTGIDGVVIWLNPGEHSRHGPRIKVSNIKGKARFDSRDCFSVSVPTDPEHVPVVVAGTCGLNAKELRRVLAFIHNNRVQLLQIWQADVLPDEVTFTKA